jgi:hypothetical protein
MTYVYRTAAHSVTQITELTTFDYGLGVCHGLQVSAIMGALHIAKFED